MKSPHKLSDLPKELAFKIVSKLDIDSRRALGVFTNLKIPTHLQDRISRVLQIPTHTLNNYIVPLGKTYIIIKSFDHIKKNEMIDHRVFQYPNNQYYMVWCILDD